MENKNFKLVLWGLILLVVGTVIFFGAWSRVDYEQVTVPEEEAVRRSKTIDEAFESVSISESACDIRLEPAADGVCRVEYSDSKYVSHKVYVKNNCLVIEEKDNRRNGFVFGLDFSGESHDLVVYLPEGEYSRLSVDSASAKLSAEEGFSFYSAEINTASGDVVLGNIVSDRLSIYSASGSVELKNIEAAGEINVGTASGTVALSNIRCRSLELGGASGDIELENVICSGEMSVETASGDVSFERCDARELEFETASGSIKGSLLSGKDFRIETVSGSIDVPKDSEGGICSIETVSGDAKITID